MTFSVVRPRDKLYFSELLILKFSLRPPRISFLTKKTGVVDSASGGIPGGPQTQKVPLQRGHPQLPITTCPQGNSVPAKILLLWP